ncbi:MAG: TolC family protein [Candidatus Cloacimonetes bacterium]|nr:TolC family protein [Candidatus Cloacimonadota bacterium]MDY0366492.1 TolC family protein [Candidatus Syntrophosphaera sp.]
MKRHFILMLLLAAVGLPGITLEESLELARQRNSTLLMAREEISRAEQSYLEVKGGFFPKLSLAGAYSLERTYLPQSALSDPIDLTQLLNPLTASDNDYMLAGSVSGIANALLPSSPMNEGSLAASLQLEQVLFAGGRLRNGLKATQRYRDISRLNLQVKEQEEMLRTIQMFYGYLLTTRLVEVQEEALATVRRHVAQVELFHREGLVAEFDVLRARLEEARLEPQLLQAQNNRDLALAAFREQIGDERETAVPEDVFSLPEPLDLTLEQALAQGLQNRAELAMAGLASELKELQWKAERGNYLPTLGLQASASLFTAADGFAIEADDFGTSYSVGIGISIPIFDGLANRARVRAARHDYLLSRLQQQDSTALIRLEITQNYHNLRHAEENYRVQMQNMRLAERGLELARVRYENQVGIQLEVFDAQTTLSAIKLQYYQAIHEVISATRMLQKSLGTIL